MAEHGDLLKTAWIKAFGAIVNKPVLSPDSVDHASIRSILIVRQHDQLGDFLLSVPVVRALRRRYPEARIGLVVREYFGEIAGFIPEADEVIVFTERLTGWSRGRLRAFIRGVREGWDLAIVLNTVSHSLTSDLIAHCSGARYLLGPERPLLGGTGRNVFYNLISPDPPSGVHQTERNLAIVRYIGAEGGDRSPLLNIPAAELESARRDLERMGLDPGGPAIGIHLGAGKRENRWPVERLAELSRILADSHGAQCIAFWGPKEEDLHARFRAEGGVRTIDAGHPPLRALAAMAARCQGFVCGDTGIMHLAAATGVPVAAVFGPTNPDEWRPAGERVECVRAASRVTGDVTPYEVLTALRSLGAIHTHAGAETLRSRA